MLHGASTSNRETSDAPLWFVIVCKELVEKEAQPSFLGEVCGQGTIRDIIIDIAHAYIQGTSNGIYMDAETGLKCPGYRHVRCQ